MAGYTEQDLEAYITRKGFTGAPGGNEPLYFQVQRSLRMELRDPQGVNDILYAQTLPPTGEGGAAYYCGGRYYRWNGLLEAWEGMTVKVSDAYIRQMVITHGSRGILFLLDYLTAGLHTGAVSFTSGAESVHLPGVKDLLDFYQTLRRTREAELARRERANTGRIIRSRRRPVGGVVEGW